MHRLLKTKSFVTATLVFCIASPLQLAGATPGISSAVAQAPTNQDRKAEVDRLNQEGIQQYRQGHSQEALETLQRVLGIVREMGDKAAERTTLNNIATIYNSLGQYPKALEVFSQLLAILKEIGDKPGESATLNNMAATYNHLAQYPKALECLSQALAIVRELGDKGGEAATLNNLAGVYRNLNQYPKVLESYQQTLAIVRELQDKAGEGTTLNNLAVVYRELGQYPKALEVSEQALAIFREIGNKVGEGKTLNNIAVVHRELGQYPKALECFEQALAIYQQLNNKSEQGTILSNIAAVYDSLGEYSQALEFYQQALAIYKDVGQQVLANKREAGDRTGEGKTLDSIGLIYQNLEQYPKALEFYQQALAIAREVGDKAGEGTTLNNIAALYNTQEQYPKAIEFLSQALVIVREIGDKVGEGKTLNNIALIYRNLGQYPKALEFYQQALALQREISDKAGQEMTLSGIGKVYFQLNQYPKALEFFSQALAINREVSDKSGEGLTLSNMGVLLEQQKQPELAIVFYKQSVNVTEAIRQEIRVLPREQQESYTKTVADTYRSLANLLLSQGRILEAQQVLELLKIQELRNFTKDRRAGGQTSGIALNATEEQIVKEYGTLIAFGQQVEQCQQTRCPQLSQLLDQRDVLTQQYNQSVGQLDREIRDRRAQDDAFLDPKKLLKAKEIVEAQPGTVLIYPLVMEDKIWLLWASKGGIVKTLQVPNVGQRQLAETVLKFRQLLQNPSSNVAEVKATSKQLYDWLILPLEPELKTNKIQNLVFSLDRAARYIPMSALFDGEKYLIENYAVSTVLSADLTDMHDRLPLGTQNTSILALGLSNAVAGFNPLPNVPAELDAIVRKTPNDQQGIYPGVKFLNNAFDFRALRDNLIGHQLLHIATHGQFVPGSPDASYLLLGTGDKLEIPKIATLQDLVNVQLVVLSACETALAGPGQDGREINGISYYFLNGGAKAVMASLWSVNDDSTRQLMQNFYSNLAKGTSTSPMTKAEALRQAQLSMLRGESTTIENADQRSIIAVVPKPGSTNSSAPGFSHPYYWAPFILIGNNL